VTRRWRPAVIVCLLVTTLTILFLGSRTPDLASRDALQEALRQLSLHDAELSRDVLLTRAGLLPNYEPLTADRRQLESDVAALRAAAAGATREAHAVLDPGIVSLATAVSAKLTATEDFKTTQAILRNSLAYLTHEAPVLQPLLKDPARASAFGRLSYVVLRYLETPEPGIGHEIEALLEQLGGGRAEPELATLVSHGRMIARVLPEVDALGAEIQSAPTRQRTSELSAAVIAYADRVEARTQRYLYALYAVSLVLLAYLILQFLRLRARTAEIEHSNASLRASEERYRAITDSAQEAIVSVDAAGKIRSWNRGATLMFGFAAEEMLGQSVALIVPDRNRIAHAQLMVRLATVAGPAEFRQPREHTGLARNGHEIPLEVSMARWSSAEGVFVTAIMRDRTERESLRSQVRHAELLLIESSRMSAVGMLSLGVAHEIRTPVQAMADYAHWLAAAWQDVGRLFDARPGEFAEAAIGGYPYAQARTAAHEAVAGLGQAADSLKRLVRELREFGQPLDREGLGPCDLREAVERAGRLLRYLVRQRTAEERFVRDLPDGLPDAWGSLPKFQQVAVNLIANALEALPDRSSGGVRVSLRHDAAAKQLILTVDDDGVGIPAENLARLGTHFFTTKAQSGGTGLGLAIARRIVEEAGGTLRFESIQGKGTRATVIVQEVAAVREQRALRDEAQRGRPGAEWRS